MCAPSSSSTTLLPSQTTLLLRTQDRGVEPITLDSTTLDLPETKATAGSHASSAEDSAFAIAQAKVVEASSLCLTTDDAIPLLEEIHLVTLKVRLETTLILGLNYRAIHSRRSSNCWQVSSALEVTGCKCGKPS